MAVWALFFKQTKVLYEKEKIKKEEIFEVRQNGWMVNTIDSLCFGYGYLSKFVFQRLWFLGIRGIGVTSKYKYMDFQILLRTEKKLKKFELFYSFTNYSSS